MVTLSPIQLQFNQWPAGNAHEVSHRSRCAQFSDAWHAYLTFTSWGKVHRFRHIPPRLMYASVKCHMGKSSRTVGRTSSLSTAPFLSRLFACPLQVVAIRTRWLVAGYIAYLALLVRAIIADVIDPTAHVAPIVLVLTILTLYDVSGCLVGTICAVVL